MRQNYQEVVNRIKQIADSHPDIYSSDVGREFEFDIKKKHEWPRFFLRTEASNITGGLGSAETSVAFTMLVMGKVDKERSDIVEVMSQQHQTMLDILATMHKDQLIRIEDNPVLVPLYDYQDTQTSGWQVAVRVYLDASLQCITIV